MRLKPARHLPTLQVCIGQLGAMYCLSMPSTIMSFGVLTSCLAISHRLSVFNSLSPELASQPAQGWEATGALRLGPWESSQVEAFPRILKSLLLPRVLQENFLLAQLSSGLGKTLYRNPCFKFLRYVGCHQCCYVAAWMHQRNFDAAWTIIRRRTKASHVTCTWLQPLFS